MNETVRKALRRVGSAETTSALIALIAVVTVAGIYLPIKTADWMVLPLCLVLANLLAAMATSAKLKSLPMLFALHAALVALIVTIAIDRLNSMSGRVEVTEGSMFDAQTVRVQAGLLHRVRLNEVKFLQGPFEINYAPGMKRRHTQSFIRIPQADASWRDVKIGDDTPLIFGDYRFYTSHNKGFAPIVTFVSAAGAAQTGSIHMPSYPANDSNQAQTWTPPGATTPLKVWLHIPEPVFDKDKPWKFAKPADTQLVVIEGEKRHELQVGDVATLAAGQVRYDGLRSWMGYHIVGQSMTHWIAAAAVMAGLALLGHVLSVLRAGPMSPAPEPEHGS